MTHASSNPASFMPTANPKAYLCSTTRELPNHIASACTFSLIHSFTLGVNGQNRNRVPSLRTNTSGVVLRLIFT
jgi:hypothetical protein